jgi:hypothetical protein
MKKIREKLEQTSTSEVLRGCAKIRDCSRIIGSGVSKETSLKIQEEVVLVERMQWNEN